MNIFNRVVVVILLVLLLAAAVLLALQPQLALGTVQNGLKAARDFLAALEVSSPWLYLLLRVGVAVVAVVVVVLLLWAELRRRGPSAVRVRTDSGSRATVTTESVARRLAWHLDQLPDVISATPEVTASGKTVSLVVRLETRPEIDVPAKTEEVVAVVREVITERMGLQLGRVHVQIKHAPYQEGA